MELETLFADQKWNILKSVSEREQSPLQLAQRLNTTIANVSQQLRLLEAAHLVKKHKIPNREKGKPRTLFSLSDDFAYLISLMDGFAAKRLLPLTDYHKIILRIWFLDNPQAHYAVERFFWKLEPLIDQIQGLALTSENDEIKVIIVSSKSREVKKKIEPHINSKKEGAPRLNLETYTLQEAERFIKQSRGPFSKTTKVLTLYDPKNILPKISSYFEGGDK